MSRVSRSIRVALTAIAGLCMVGATQSVAANATTTSSVQPTGKSSGYTLTFDDEFSSTSVDGTKWTDCYPWKSCANAGNANEVQCYTPANRSVANGLLDITVKSQSYSCNVGGTRKYTSALLQTDGKFSQTYGFYEARLKIPAGLGMWPALWSLPTSHAWPPEIDALEVFGSQDHPDHTTHTVHYGSSSQSLTKYYPSTPVDFSAGFHVFGVDWEPDAITWYVDGHVVKRFTDTANIPKTAQYLIVNLAINGNHTPDILPGHMLVDYVRMWRRV